MLDGAHIGLSVERRFQLNGKERKLDSDGILGVKHWYVLSYIDLLVCARCYGVLLCDIVSRKHALAALHRLLLSLIACHHTMPFI